MTAKQYTDLMVRLGRMDAKQDAQSDIQNANNENILKRLDISNGRLSKHDEIIIKLANHDTFDEGKEAGISNAWKIVVACLSLIVAILGVIVAWKAGILIHN